MVEHERLSAALTEQVAYYRRAAADFDKYTYDEFLDVVASRLQGQVDLAGDVLEIACGAGQWTAWLAESAHFLTAIDSAPEMLEFARRRLKGHPTGQVKLLCADVFEWRPQRRYQTVFFAFWLSHVPPSRFAAFWELMAACLAPRGSVAFVDDGAGAAVYEDDLVADPELPTARRRLHGAGWRRGGNAFWPAESRAGDEDQLAQPDSQSRVVKVLHDSEELTRQLTALGWSARVEPLSDARFVGWAHLA